MRKRDRAIMLVAVALVVLIATSLTAYYLVGYNSVKGTIVQLTSIRRVFTGSDTMTFYVEARVSSSSAALETQVVSPRFDLTVDTNPISVASAPTRTFKPNESLSYTLVFQRIDSAFEQTMLSTTSSYVLLTLDATVKAGFYQNLLYKQDATTTTWQTGGSVG